MSYNKDNIGNTYGFNSIASIALSRDFSDETLAEVWLCYKRLSQIEVFLSQMSYSLVVMLELNGVSEVQYKKIIIMITRP